MNKADVIKALECFAVAKDFDETGCIGCAFETRGICLENCSDGLAKLALDLLNRQKAEIERLEKQARLDDKYIKCLEKSFNDRTAEFQTANAEIKKKDKKIEELSEVLSDTIRIRYAEAKAEAIKEFAERLKKEMYTERGFSVCPDDTIDNLVKEMVGECNGNFNAEP